jgi:DNA-binding protein Fis
MSKTIKSPNFAFYRNNNTNSRGKSLILARAIGDIEDFFMQEKKGELYRFLLNVVEKPLIEKVLYKTEGNQFKAAEILGINRNTLHAKIQKLKINIGDFKKGGMEL